MLLSQRAMQQVERYASVICCCCPVCMVLGFCRVQVQVFTASTAGWTLVSSQSWTPCPSSQFWVWKGQKAVSAGPGALHTEGAHSRKEPLRPGCKEEGAGQTTEADWNPARLVSTTAVSPVRVRRGIMCRTAAAGPEVWSCTVRLLSWC